MRKRMNSIAGLHSANTAATRGWRSGLRWGVAAAALLCAPLAFGETVRGHFTYSDTNGAKPIASAKVEIWRYAYWTWANAATVWTNSDGRFEQPMPFLGSGVVYAVRVFATNAGAVVWPDDVVHTFPFYREPGEPGTKYTRTVRTSTDVADFDYNFSDAFAVKHFNLAETVRIGYQYAAARRDPNERDGLTPVNVQPTGAAVMSWYNPAADTLVIRSTDVMNDRLILHEYAHALQARIGSFAWIPANHNGCEARDVVTGQLINSAEHAWMEGFASYFAAVVSHRAGSAAIADNGWSGTMSPAHLESPAACTVIGLPGSSGVITANMVEERVAAMLWDLFDNCPSVGTCDGIPESFDTLSRMDLAVFQIMDRELGVRGVWPTVRAFYDAWVARGLPVAPLASLFKAYGLSLPVTYPVAVQTVNGNYLTAVGGGNRLTDVLHSDATSIGAWEKFTLVQLGRQCALKTASGNYVTFVGGGGRLNDVVHTDATAAGAWEKFTLVPQGGSRYAVQTATGNYLTAVGGGGMLDDVVHTDATGVGLWEIFTLAGLPSGVCQ